QDGGDAEERTMADRRRLRDQRRAGGRRSDRGRHWPVASMSVWIVAITDMPGRSLPASGCPGSSRILTGMRWTTLVKLPVALSGGSNVNCEPLAGATLSTRPQIVTPGKLSTVILARWPTATRVSWVSL